MPVDWNAHLLQGFQASHAARLQHRQQGSASVSASLTAPPTSPPSLPSASGPSTGTDWTAELHCCFSTTFAARLERRRHYDPYPGSKLLTPKYQIYKGEEWLHSLSKKRQEFHKRFKYDVDELDFRSRQYLKADEVNHGFEAQAARDLEQRRHLDDWRLDMMKLITRAHTVEEHEGYLQRLNEGPPPGWLAEKMMKSGKGKGKEKDIEC